MIVNMNKYWDNIFQYHHETFTRTNYASDIWRWIEQEYGAALVERIPNADLYFEFHPRHRDLHFNDPAKATLFMLRWA